MILFSLIEIAIVKCQIFTQNVHTHGNYQVITFIFKKYGYLPLCLENYTLFLLLPIFTNNLYTYSLRYIIYLGEPSGNIILNYHGTFIHMFMHWYDTSLNIYIINRFFLDQCCHFICQCIFFLANITSKKAFIFY